MKVLYLFTSYRAAVLERAKRGEDHGNGFWGMIRLPHFGVDATYAEPEQFYPKWLSEFIRKRLGVYWLHLSVFFTFFKYDFIFTSTAFGTQFVHALLHIGKPRWVMHDFSITGLLGNEKKFKQKMLAYAVRRCAGIVTLSLEEKEKLEKRFPHLVGRIEFIPFGIGLDFFRPMDIAQVPQVLAVGFDPDRDWKTFFQAVEGLDMSVITATRAERVKRLTIPPNVSIKQFPSLDLAREYARSEIIVVPLDTSRGVNDAMGASALFEAMATGKPVVVTRTLTTSSYITDGENGLLVPPGDPEALRSAIERLHNDEALRTRLGQAARRYAEANLDAEMLAGRLAAFFKRL
jgi:glycosyltransferase involved in cell wall biosynthesis